MITLNTITKTKNVIKLVTATALLQLAGLTIAEDSLDALVQEVGAGRAKEQQTFNERVQAYNTATPSAQAKMMADAQARLGNLKATSSALADQFSQNEVKLSELDKAARDKAASLGLAEVFGLTRQVAGDVAMTLQQSLTSTQFTPKPGEANRADALRALAQSKSIPTTADLEKLWFEIQREMVATGQVARYSTTVIQASGDPVAASVVRIGPFTALSDGKYLSYVPELQALKVYPRQPDEEILKYGKALESATDGYVQTVVDSARGVLMSLYVERPTWVQRIENGEHINYLILIVGAVAFGAFLVQLLYLVAVRAKTMAQLKHLDKPNSNNPLGRVLQAFKGDDANIEQDADVVELRIAEVVSREVPKLERTQSLLRLAVAAGPLLGLIGTVLGMIITFQSITESGSSDPKLMAEGIGAAMIATVLGLGIAIPLLFANALLASLSGGITQVIEEQAAGMLAEKIEKSRHV